MDAVEIKYRIELPDGSVHLFNLALDAHRLELLPDLPEELPAWTELDVNRCENCPTDEVSKHYCPLAVNLIPIVECFEQLVSWHSVHVDVFMDGGCLSRETTAQEAISSLMGILIAGSRCPHTAFLKSMVRFHRPLSSGGETVCRATGYYLMAQYYRRRDGKPADFDLAGLKELYEDLRIVNASIAQRLREVTTADSSVNAVILLDAYAQAIPLIIDDALDEFRYMFAPYFEELDRAYTRLEETHGDGHNLKALIARARSDKQ